MGEKRKEGWKSRWQEKQRDEEKEETSIERMTDGKIGKGKDKKISGEKGKMQYWRVDTEGDTKIDRIRKCFRQEEIREKRKTREE